jgi:pyruvate/2-oxoglutarate/acetoin dehydrogenase E1 component
MSLNDRVLNYVEAIREATYLEMKNDPKVSVFGLDVDDHNATFGTNRGLLTEFGPDRVFGTPLSEDAMTGVAVGMALAGMRPIHLHYRMDFTTLAMNQLINVAAKTHAMSGGAQHVPMTVRMLIGKSWGQGAQHSQSLYPLFMNIPGLKIAVPTTPFDAKACLQTAVRDDNPVLFVEHRLLYFQRGPVPEGDLMATPGQGRITVPGTDVTLVGISYQQVECMKAQIYLERIGIQAEVIDPIWLAPLDLDIIEQSVRRTQHLIVVDNAWMTCGAGAEIIAALHERLGDIKWQARRLGFAPTPCPTTPSLEQHFYPSAENIAAAANDLVNQQSMSWLPDPDPLLKNIEFKGPF